MIRFGNENSLLGSWLWKLFITRYNWRTGAGFSQSYSSILYWMKSQRRVNKPGCRKRWCWCWPSVSSEIRMTVGLYSAWNKPIISTVTRTEPFASIWLVVLYLRIGNEQRSVATERPLTIGCDALEIGTVCFARDIPIQWLAQMQSGE